jgi:branched-chain amino acid transport system substrate-binding protein
MNPTLRILLPTIAALLLAGVAPAAEPIRIGVAGAHSGDLAPYGIPTLHAAELVVKEVNAKGGILGRKVELVVQDDQCKPEVAANVAAKLVTQNVSAVLGHICSGATKAALGTYREARLIAISPSATAPELTLGGSYPNFYRTIGSDATQARVAADFALQQLKARKIAILHDKQDYGKGFAEYARRYIEQAGGAQVVLFEGITAGAVDYSAVLQKVRRENPEVLIYGGYHPEASKLVGQMRQKRMATVFLSDDGVKDDNFLKVAGASAEGAYATGPRNLATNPLYARAVEQHKKAYGADPGAFYAEGYAATLALLNAIQKAGSTSYDALAKALRTEYVDTPVGRIRFDAHGDAEGVGFSVYQVKNRKYVEVK